MFQVKYLYLQLYYDKENSSQKETWLVQESVSLKNNKHKTLFKHL